MRNVLDSILATGSAQAVCCQLAACTSFQAFEMLCAQCEHRGLVFVPSRNPQQKLGEVFYDRDASWQHELVSGNLSAILAVDLAELAGEAPSDMLVACLQLTCKNPLQPCVPLAVSASFCDVGINIVEMLSFAPSPRVALETRNKECDFAWIASDYAPMDGVPAVVLEVAVFNENETELEAEGSEWMDLPQVQVGPSL